MDQYGLYNDKESTTFFDRFFKNPESESGPKIRQIAITTFNQHFTSIASTINERIEPSDRPPDSYLEESEHIFSIPENTTAQIVEVVLKWQNKRSFVLKKIIDSVKKKPLCHIFNLSIKSGKVPTKLKIAKTTVFKAGGDMH